MRDTWQALTPSAGIVVTTDPQGTIVGVVEDGLGLASGLTAGRPLADAIASLSMTHDDQARRSATRFMDTLRAEGFALDWELPIVVRGRQTVVKFSGGATNDGLLIVGQTNRSGVRRLFDELGRVNNETINALLTAVRQAAVASHSRNERDDEFLTELNRANSSVLTAQRELARKNDVLSQTNGALEAAHTALEKKQADLEKANARLDALATIDGLTGAKNRRAFDEVLDSEMARSNRYPAPLSLVLLDVDKFKLYNDRFGHLAGDDTLKAVVRLLSAHTRQTESVARYGGEEFVIVMPHTTAEGATAAAERLRQIIASAEWPSSPVTASFGVATVAAGIRTSTALIAAADRALYASKARGRNTVTHVASLTDPDLAVPVPVVSAAS
ncbi:MAG: GGDEF domain-containing protein [Acidobacteriota bacterium]